LFYPSEVVEEVRAANDIVDVVSSYVQLRRKSGSNFFGLCPFHREKSPSFSVNAERQIYHCFGCGAGGNVIGFIMQIENHTFPDALKMLADRVHIALPETDRRDASEYARRAKERERVLEINRLAARFFYDALKTFEGGAASRYLDARGVSPKTRVRFGLGFSPTDRTSLISHLKAHDCAEGEVQTAGLAVPDRNGALRDRFHGRLMFPIIEPSGGVVGFGGRVLDGGEPKYLNSPDTPAFDKSRNLYGVQFARKAGSRTIILVEGYMDVIALHQAGFENAVAALGTAFNVNHIRLLRKYCGEAVLLFDSDEAGTKAALRAIPVFRENGLPVKVLRVKDAKDPDEYIRKYGPDAFRELLKEAEPDVRFRVSQLLRGYDLDRTDQKVKFAAEAAKIVASLPSAIEREAYGKEIAAVAGLSAEAVGSEADREILKEAERERRREAQTRETQRREAPRKEDYGEQPEFAGGRQSGPRNRSSPREKGLDDARRSLLYWMTADRAVCAAVRPHLEPRELGGEVYARLLELVCAAWDKNEPPVPAGLCSFFETAEEQSAASDVYKDSLSYADRGKFNREINDALLKIKKTYLKTQIEAAANDPPLMKDLLETRKNVENLYITISDG